ncbi:MAG: transcription elongation factor GreA [Patescibacteria group bacterium]
MKYISPEKYKELREKLTALKENRKDISEQIKEAQERGDISESAEYTEAKESQAFNEGKIKELEQFLGEAKLVDKKHKCDYVDVGCKITVKNSDSKKEFTLVGSEEADPSKGMISNESPLGRAFFGKKKGEEVVVLTPNGKIHYKILDIE